MLFEKQFINKTYCLGVMGSPSYIPKGDTPPPPCPPNGWVEYANAHKNPAHLVSAFVLRAFPTPLPSLPPLAE